jgi:hypothetical protein
MKPRRGFESALLRLRFVEAPIGERSIASLQDAEAPNASFFGAMPQKEIPEYQAARRTAITGAL